MKAMIQRLLAALTKRRHAAEQGNTPASNCSQEGEGTLAFAVPDLLAYGTAKACVPDRKGLSH